jgi:hypothetical protein
MKHRNVRRSRSVAVLCIIPMLLTGCYNASPDNWASVANGVNGDAGPVEIRALLIVSSDAGDPGRLLGTFSNDSAQDVDVVISDADDSISLTVPANGSHPLDTQPATLDTVSDIPGSLVPLTVQAGHDRTELQVPVMDGSLDQYRPYLPGAPSSSK